MINWTGPYGASQQSTQRFGSLPTLRDAKMYVFFEKKLPATLWCQKIHNHFFFMKPFFTSWSMINKKFKISIYTFLNIYIHFFQSAYAAKRRIDCDCDVSMHDRCRCLRLLRNEGLWPTDKWRYHEFKSSEESLFFSKKKKRFQTIKHIHCVLKLINIVFLQFYLYVQYVDTSSYKLNIVW